MHVADLATAHVQAIGALEQEPALVCNLGSGTGSSVAEVIGAIRSVTGHPLPVRVAARRAGDPSSLVAANDRASAVLGWSPTHSLTEIVRDAWAAAMADASDEATTPRSPLDP